MKTVLKLQLSAILSMACYVSAQAQSFPYEATVFSSEYNELQNPTLLDIELGWDDPTVPIDLPFLFPFGDYLTNQIMLAGTGEMLMTLDENGTTHVLWPLSLDVIDAANAMTKNPEDISTIGYQIEGNEPNRIFKIEWNNCGIYEEIEDFGTSEIRVNWQVWLHESTNIIEYRFGPTTMTAEHILTVLQGFPFSSGIILNWEEEGYTGDLYTASGEASAPTWSLDSAFDTWYYSGQSLTTVPDDGSGYRFNMNATSIPETAAGTPSFTISPNPASNFCLISNPTRNEQQLTCLSLEGKVVQRWIQSPWSSTQLDVSAFPPGLYLIQNTQGISQKLIIQ